MCARAYAKTYEQKYYSVSTRYLTFRFYVLCTEYVKKKLSTFPTSRPFRELLKTATREGGEFFLRIKCKSFLKLSASMWRDKIYPL